MPPISFALLQNMFFVYTVSLVLWTDKDEYKLSHMKLFLVQVHSVNYSVVTEGPRLGSDSK